MIELPTLYSLRKDKKVNQWTVGAEGDVVVMAYGVIGGKQAVTRTRSTPTNVGQSNHRDGKAQAQFEAKAAWDKKRDEGYFESIEEAKTVTVILPMLAQNAYVKRKRKGETIEELRPISFPCHAQRKLNGLRCLATRDKLVSREGTEWKIPHIQEHVKRCFGESKGYLDGEIYWHGTPLQTLNSLIKDYRLESHALEFHVYDMPCDLEWNARYEALKYKYAAYSFMTTECGDWPSIRIVETELLRSMEDLLAFEKIVRVEGYEGVIIRQFDKPYLWNTRCDSLLKWKRFKDEEFLIVDVLPRELIKADMSVIWICDKFVCKNNVNDRTFEVVPKGTEAERARFLERKEDYIGKRLNVRFLERSVDGVPQGNPVGNLRADGDTPEAKTEDEDWTS